MAWSGTGAGTSGDPYIVDTAARFDEVRTELAAYFRQTVDLALTDYQAGAGWVTIADFTGTYDGNNKKITQIVQNNIYVTKTELIAVTGGGSVINLLGYTGETPYLVGAETWKEYKEGALLSKPYGVSTGNVMLVAGGGGGGEGDGGGGGGGGLIPFGSAVTFLAGGAIKIGKKGLGGIVLPTPVNATNGGNSSFVHNGGTLTAVGGGKGCDALDPSTGGAAGDGGSGGGDRVVSTTGPGDGTAGQGYAGGDNGTVPYYGCGGGGGAGAVGQDGTGTDGGDGGVGVTVNSYVYSSGGGGGVNQAAGTPGDGGVGAGDGSGSGNGGDATQYGCGGGGGKGNGNSETPGDGGDGYDGIIIIAYTAVTETGNALFMGGGF